MKINNVGMTGVNPYNLQANKTGNIKESKVKSSDKVEISSAAKKCSNHLRFLLQDKQKWTN